MGTVDTEVSNSSAESLKITEKEIFDCYVEQVYKGVYKYRENLQYIQIWYPFCEPQDLSKITT